MLFQLNKFAADQIFETVALADDVNVGAVDENLGRARTAVVVRRHDEAVSAGAHHGEQVALRGFSHLTLAREEIAALADWADDVRRHGLARLAAIDGNDRVVGLVEHRTNQVVHCAVDNDKALHVGFFIVEHARHQHARVANHHASRLGDYLEPEVLDWLQERVRVLRRRRRLLLIRDAEAAAEVEILERDSRAAQPPDNRGDLLPRFGKRRHLGYLRADMRAEADDFKLRQRARFGVIFVDLRKRHAELAVAMAGGNMRMRPRIEIGINTQADRRAMLHAARDLGHAMQFRTRLDVDHEDAGFERGGDLLVGLADAGEHDLARVRADPQASHQLADGDDVEARAHRREQFQDAQVGERLHRVADQMIGAGEGLVENAEVAPESARAINEKGSVNSPRQVGDRHVFGKKLIVAVFEVVHCDVVSRSGEVSFLS